MHVVEFILWVALIRGAWALGDDFGKITTSFIMFVLFLFDEFDRADGD
jgi:hypothetical protein